ncbi:MAG: DUF1178 family protein [Sphingomonadales bacterium]
MIVYDLKCVCGHEFEAWFKDSAGFEQQRDNGAVVCPLCGNQGISKALMTPNLSMRRSDRDTVAKSGALGEMYRTLEKLRSRIENTCDYVGDKFAEEARKIHYGEVGERGIYGEATKEESDELRDEGVDFVQLPMLPRHDS